MNPGELQDAVNAIVQQIVTLAKPQRVLLFGSAAKRRWTGDSDLDFLVVVSHRAESATVLDRLNTRVRRGRVPCDFLVVTARTLQRQRDNPGLIYRQILEEGQELYAR